MVAAGTNEQAIAAIEAQHFAAALLDLNLNGVRNYPVVDALAERGVPFAFVTAYGGHGLRDGDREWPLLVKPFPLASLKHCLSGCCQPAAEGVQNDRQRHRVAAPII